MIARSWSWFDHLYLIRAPDNLKYNNKTDISGNIKIQHIN